MIQVTLSVHQRRWEGVHNADTATARLPVVPTTAPHRRERLVEDAVFVNVFTSTGRNPIDV